MNILLLHTYLRQNCGISTYIKILAQGLRARNHTVYIAALDTPQAHAFIDGEAPFLGVELDQYRKNPYTFSVALFQLIRLIQTLRIEVILSTHRWGSFIAYFATRLTGCRLVSVDQNILWGNKRLTLWGDHVISISRFGKQHLIDYFGLSEDSISIIYNATRSIYSASESDQQRIRKELGLTNADNDPILINVGRLEEQKGQVYLLQAMPAIMCVFPNVRLLIVGEGGLESRLRGLVREYGMESNVVFTGLRDDVPTLLSLADLFVMPSLWEGLPFAMLEAMWLGLPVVATSVGGVPEVINLDTPPLGRLVPPKDSAALASTIISVLSQRSTLREMAARSKEMVQGRFSVDLMIEQTEQVLRAVVRRCYPGQAL